MKLTKYAAIILAFGFIFTNVSCIVKDDSTESRKENESVAENVIEWN
ncbi:MAG: hypothetical protein LBM87_00640 [Ruminococcus sp.]|jgi:hypothetical protein|nr:hypothetical protein [Ruminococcus sp.]